jgi:hypothetical protein
VALASGSAASRVQVPCCCRRPILPLFDRRGGCRPGRRGLSRVWAVCPGCRIVHSVQTKAHRTGNTEPVAPSSTTPTSFPPGLAASAYDPQERLQPRSAPCSVHHQPTTSRRGPQGQRVLEGRKEQEVRVFCIAHCRRQNQHAGGHRLAVADASDPPSGNVKLARKTAART